MITNLVKLSLEAGGKIAPSIIPGELIDGTGLCNSSVFIDENGDIILNIRHVHYSLYHSEFNQKYWCTWGCLAYLNPEDDICLKTGNYLCKLDPDTLYVKEFKKVDTSKHDIEPNWEFKGLEDARVVKWDEKLFISGVRRDIIDNGEGRMELCEINWDNSQCEEITRDRILPPSYTYLEKNWMPILDMPYCYIKWTAPLEIVEVDLSTKRTSSAPKGKINVVDSKTIITRDFTLPGARHQRGGSQVIPFREGRVAILHECNFFHNDNDKKDAHYYHRFIFWDKDWNVTKITKPFKFMEAQIEFNCGLAQKGDNFLITFGYQDNAAYVLQMPINILDQLEYDNSGLSTIISNSEDEKFIWKPIKPGLWKIIKKEIFEDNIYQKYNKVQDGDVVVDIGANVGAFSYLALKKNIKHLYSIEPSKLLLPTLTKNIGENNNVDIINYRISDNNSSNNVIIPTDLKNNIYDDPGSTYDNIKFKELIKKYKIEKIDFLKCDCEGGEYYIFNKENKEWIINNVKHVAAEFHLWGIPSALDNFYIFRDLYLQNKENFIVEDRKGNDVTKHMGNDKWLKAYSWDKRTRAQLNIYIKNCKEI